MTCVSKDYHWQCTQCRYDTSRLDNPNIVWAGVRVDRKVVDDQNDEISNRNQSNQTGILERVKPLEKAQWDNEKHKGSNPKVSVHQIRNPISGAVEAQGHSGHKVADNNHVGDPNPEALNRDSGVENDGRIGICQLRQGEEGGFSAVEVACASGLEVETKGRGQARPDHEEHTEHYSHVRQDRGHGKCAGPNNFTSPD